MPDATLLWVVGVVLGVAGLLVSVWSLRGDRSRGRRRCPKCWYDMGGHEGRRCPECGREAKKEKHLFRARRRWRVAVIGAFLLLVASGLCFTAEGVRQGWDKVTPLTALIIIARYSDDPWALRTLETRVFRTGSPFDYEDRLWKWQWNWYGRAILGSAQSHRALAVRQLAFQRLRFAMRDPARVQTVLPLIEAGAADPDPSIRSWAATTLGSGLIPVDFSMPLLESMLNDSLPIIRASAVRSLSRLATRTTGALPQVLAALNDQDKLVRITAIDALADFAKQNGCPDEVLDALLRAFREDTDDHVRSRALEAVALSGCPEERIRELVLESLRSPVDWIRSIAIELLPQVKKDNDVLVSHAVEALNNRSLLVVIAGAELLLKQTPQQLKAHVDTIRSARKRLSGYTDKVDVTTRSFLDTAINLLDRTLSSVKMLEHETDEDQQAPTP